LFPEDLDVSLRAGYYAQERAPQVEIYVSISRRAVTEIITFVAARLDKTS
jgi:hypothetical protein